MKQIACLFAMVMLVSGCAHSLDWHYVHYPSKSQEEVNRDTYSCNQDAKFNCYASRGDFLYPVCINKEYRYCMEAKYGYAREEQPAGTGFYNRGVEYGKESKLSKAISYFTKAIKINPKMRDAYYSRGYAYGEQGKFTQAIADYSKAIEIGPNYAEVYYNRGTIYIKQNNFTQAISDFTKAIEIEPNYADAYNNRGASYYTIKEYDKAWADVHKAEELGLTMPSNFIKQLKKDSGKEK